jgi:hypothetical protein
MSTLTDPGAITAPLTGASAAHAATAASSTRIAAMPARISQRGLSISSSRASAPRPDLGRHH